MDSSAWLVAVAFWSACLIAVQVGMRFAIKYDLSQHELRVLLFRVVTLTNVRLSDVASVEVVPFRRLLVLSLKSKLFWAARAGNRLYARQVVVIRRRSGKGRPLIISPDHPEEFARRLEQGSGRESRTLE